MWLFITIPHANNNYKKRKLTMFIEQLSLIQSSPTTPPLPAPRRPWWIRDGCPHFTDSRVRQQGWESLCSFHPSLLPSHEGGLPQTQYLLGSRHILPGSGAPPLLLSETLYKPANSPSASRPSRRAWERQRCRPGQLSIHALV